MCYPVSYGVELHVHSKRSYQSFIQSRNIIRLSLDFPLEMYSKFVLGTCLVIC